MHFALGPQASRDASRIRTCLGARPDDVSLRQEFDPSVGIAVQLTRSWLFLRKFFFEFTGEFVYVRCFTK